MKKIGSETIPHLNSWKEKYPGAISDVRGKGLLIALELTDDTKAAEITARCLEKGLILNLKHGHIIRIFPALTITTEELRKGLDILEAELQACYT